MRKVIKMEEENFSLDCVDLDIEFAQAKEEE